MASPPITSWVGLAALLVGCAGPAVEATGPAAPTVVAADAAPPAASPEAPLVKVGVSAQEALARPTSFFRAPPAEAATLPPGLLVVKEDESRGRPPVAPTAIDLDALPLVSLPEPLEGRAPDHAMDHGPGPVIVDDVVESWRRNAATSRSVYVRLQARLARVQIGAVGPAFNASSRVYRTCYPTRRTAMIQTMRWQALGVDPETGKPVLQIGDGWFDSVSCTASTVRTTRVELEPLLGGLIHGFRVACDDCGGGARLAVVGPRLRELHVSGLGGDPFASHADFTLVQLPLRQGGAASLSATVDEHAARSWSQAHPDLVSAPTGGHVALGVELAHPVSSSAPTAIAYATVIQR